MSLYQLDRWVQGRERMEEARRVEQWVSVEQIARHLNVKAFTIYKWVERKEMPAHKVGRLWRFKITEIDQWVRRGDAAEEKSKK